MKSEPAGALPQEPSRSVRRTIAVLMGGTSAEREVSLVTGATVVDQLQRRHAVKPVEILPDGTWRVARGFANGGPGLKASSGLTEPPRHPLEAARGLLVDGVEVIFNALHGPLGEDGTIQGFLRVLGLPFTGPDVIPAAVTMDKTLTKRVLVSVGVRTPRFFVVRAGERAPGPVQWRAILDREVSRVPLPWILKPNRLGSSVGVAIFRTREEVEARADHVLASWPAHALSDDLLVEEAISGRELTCGVLEGRGPARALLPIEIRPRSSAFFDYDAKYVPGASEELCPAPLSPEETRRVQETALRVHETFQCAPLSRTDLFLTPEGDLQVLEVNTLPGMTPTSLVPLAASQEGLSLLDLFERIVDHAVARASHEASRSPGRV